MYLSSRVFLVVSLVLSPFAKASEKEDVACMDAEVDYDIAVKKYEPITLESGATVSLGKTECIDGMAGDFPCKNTNLLSMLSPQTLNCGKDAELERMIQLSDVWGWTDPESGREFALVCQQTQSTYVEVTDPENPIVLGSLKFSSENYYTTWCDIKVFKNFAYVVSESENLAQNDGEVWAQGVQIVDLTQLLTDTPCEETPEITAVQRFTGGDSGPALTNAHNIFINEDTGFGYVVGAGIKESWAGRKRNTTKGEIEYVPKDVCKGGLYIMNLQNPADPKFEACYEEDGYTHDVQCVLYNGPDSNYVGKEICFACNEDSVTIIDVTDKSNMKMISKATYEAPEGKMYTHQGWLTADHKYFVFNDEYDEYKFAVNHTTSYVANVIELASPTVKRYTHETTAIDHNNYEKNGYFYQANYRAGLRVLQPTDIENAEFEEVAYFDIHPEDDLPIFGATWSTFPFFSSDTVLISGKEQGLFMVDVTSAADPEKVDNGCIDVTQGIEAGPKTYEEVVLESGVKVAMSKTECVDGMAGEYPCKNTDVLSLLSPLDLSCGEMPERMLDSNLIDMWGWTDPDSGREFALVCQQTQSTYVEVTDPENPIVLGSLKFSEENYYTKWCDIKVYKNFAYIVAESKNLGQNDGKTWAQGVQVVDLKQLLTDTPCEETPEITAVMRFNGGTGPFIENAHNIFINEDTGFAYAVGHGTPERHRGRKYTLSSGEVVEPVPHSICGAEKSGGLYIINLANPSDPQFEACYEEDGYSHDVQCVIYNGPDSRYVGREICFASNEGSYPEPGTSTVSIIDVTDKSNIVLLSRTTYPNAVYTHQGWLTEDHAYFVFNDEIDEYTNTVNKTMTYVANVMDLEDVTINAYEGRTTAIDHNEYIKNGYVYQANYRAGLNVLKSIDLANAKFEEVAYFDVYPEDDDAEFNGAFSTYPYFPSGIVAVTGMEQGLFLLDVTSVVHPEEADAEENSFSLDLFSLFLNR